MADLNRSEAMDIVLTAEMLEWLRELPSLRALHMLHEIAALLRRHKERAWDERLTQAALRLEMVAPLQYSDQTLASMQEILDFFGAEQSLRDVYLSRETGHDIKRDEVEAVNARLGALTMDLLLSARQTVARVAWTRRRA
ncbi:MAG TPA: hypothetical protein VIU38_08360 [Anaerolineales bacterium]